MLLNKETKPNPYREFDQQKRNSYYFGLVYSLYCIQVSILVLMGISNKCGIEGFKIF